MFVSGPAQRRGKFRAKEGTDARNMISTLQNIPAGLRINKVDSTNGTKRRRTAKIGGPEVSGLTIQGRHSRGAQDPDVPDYEQCFPISFSGMGLPKFATPIKISSVVGDLRVTGDVYANNVSGTPPISIEGPLQKDNFVVLGNISLANGFTMSTRKLRYTFNGPLVTCWMEAAWSTKAGFPDGDQVVLFGLPVAPVDIQAISVLHSDDIETTDVNTHLTGRVEIGNGTYSILEQHVTHTPGPSSVSVLTGANFSETGTMTISYTYLRAFTP